MRLLWKNCELCANTLAPLVYVHALAKPPLSRHFKLKDYPLFEGNVVCILQKNPVSFGRDMVMTTRAATVGVVVAAGHG